LVRSLSILVVAFLACAGCSSSAPDTVQNGPRLSASKVAEWPAPGPAREAAFSRDGRLVALSDASGAITIRDTGNWRPLERLNHPGGATSVAFSSDGRELFSAGYDGVVLSWSRPGGQLLRTFEGAQGTIWTIDVSPDGKLIAAAGEDQVIRIWNLDSKAPPRELRGHSRNIWRVRFSPDGKQLASGSYDNDLRLWDLGRGGSRALKGHSQAIVGLDYSPDGERIATGADDSTIRIWSAPDGATLRTVNNGKHVDAVHFSPDGKWLMSGGHAHGTAGAIWRQLTGGGGDGDAVRIWRAADMVPVAILPHPDDVISLAISPDGQWLITSGEDGRFRLWRLVGTKD
jgi:WD40 repeat protein